MNSQFTGKDPDAGKDRRQKEKGTAEDEMFGWHHQLNGHESEQNLRDGKRVQPGMLQSMGSEKDSVTEQQQMWDINPNTTCSLS